jgi:hypothetical protein
MHVDLYFSLFLKRKKEQLYKHHMAFMAMQIAQHLDLLECL